MTGPASTNSSEKLRPGLRSSKLNNCLKQEAAENYKAAITYSDNVSAVEVWADSWACGSSGKGQHLPMAEAAPN